MRIFELASANRSLKFINVAQGTELTLSEMPLVALPNIKKSLAFLYLDNSLESIAIFWSFMRSHHCVALLAPNLSLSYKTELELLYQPTFIFDPFRETIERFKKIDSINGSLFFCNTEAVYVINERNKLLISTSGSTGSPKFVKISEENLIANALSIASYLPIDKDDVTPLNLPIYYSYGLSVLTSNALKGGKIVCGNEDVLKKSFWELFTKYQYTSIAGVPFVYEMLDRIGFRSKIYPSLKYLTQAGGKLHENLISKYASYASERNILFYVMYGQTEATARMSYLPPDKLKDKIGSIGIPIPGGHFEIDTVTSELCYSGPNVFGGYANSRDDLADYFTSELLRTGDIAKCDDDGFYYITGRLKRFVKLFGSRINLDEVESMIAKHYSLIAKCIGINDKELIVFLTTNFEHADNIKKLLSHELQVHISVIKIRKLNEIPMTVNGKVDYTMLTSLYDDR